MVGAAARVRALLPGLLALGAIALVAHVVAGELPHVSALVLAVGLGALLGNLVGVPERLQAGVDQHDLLLETGIVLLGASVPLASLLEAGAGLAALVVGTVAFGILFVEALARWVFPISRREGSLLAAGASICGVSAVVAVGRGIDADRDSLAYVAGAVLLLDAVTLVAFPAVGGLVGLPDRVYGVWAGLAMFSTGPVAAAGFAVSAEAGRWATITKLARNALIGAVAVGYAMAYARGADAGASKTRRARAREIWEGFPKFLVGFFAVAAIANAGVLSPDGIDLVVDASGWLFAVAFAGVGLSIRLDELRSVGHRPVAVLLVYLLAVSALALLATLAVL